MLIDFQQHYTPKELLKGDPGKATVELDRDGNPHYLLNPQLADLASHVRMMDLAGIDAGVLSSGPGFDQPDLAICRQINDRMREAELAHPGRFIGLAHVPALKPAEAAAELKRCAVELGFPGVVIGSELQDQPLDAEELRPFWKSCADLDLYVFIHPLPRVIRWSRMDADDLGRMLGWEFSLMTAAVRLINSGLLDELPTLKIQFAHFAGGIGRYLGRIRGFQDREAVRHRQSRPPRPSAAPAVRPLRRPTAVLRHRRLGRARSRRGMGRALGPLRLRGAQGLAARLRHRLSASGARGRRCRGLCRRRCARSAAKAAPSPAAPMPKNSFPISNGG